MHLFHSAMGLSFEWRLVLMALIAMGVAVIWGMVEKFKKVRSEYVPDIPEGATPRASAQLIFSLAFLIIALVFGFRMIVGTPGDTNPGQSIKKTIQKTSGAMKTISSLNGGKKSP